MCVVPITLQQTFPLQTVTPHPTTLNTPDLSPPSLSPLLGIGLRSEPSVNKTHNTSHLPPSSHLHGHFANTNSEAWTVTGKEVSPMTTAAPEQRCPQTAFRCTIKQSGLWLDKGNVSHDRVGGGGRRRLMNRGQTAVRTHISRATGVLKQPGETVTLYQQETERGNEMVSRSRFLYLCLCVRTWVLWFHECRQGRKKKKKSKSRYISGAKYSSTLQWGTELQKQHLYWYSSQAVSDKTIFRAVAGVWRYPRASERSD